MRRLPAFNPYMLVVPGIRVIFLALIACAASLALQAQTEARTAAPSQNAPAILPADPAPAAAASFAASASGLGQSLLQSFILPGASSDNSSQWNRSMLDPFQPGPNFGNFSRSTENFNRFGGAGIGGRQDRLGSAFQIDASNQRGLASGGKGMLSPSPFALPSFNALMRGNRNQPLNSSPGTFKLSSPDMLQFGGDAGDLAHPFGSAMFINSDLGNGVLFSAGTGNSGRSTAGAPAASLGNGTPGTKHSGAAVNLKLSF
jgi:hypothetical protein